MTAKKSFVLLAIAAFIIYTPASAEETASETPDLVEIRTNDDLFQSYIQRRERHGWTLGFGAENYFPNQFTSEDGLTYEEMFGRADIPMYYFDLGYKFNLGPGSLGVTGSLAAGEISDQKSSQLRKMSVQRRAAKATISLDGIMTEPYLVPYVTAAAYQLLIDESAPTAGLSFSGQTKWAMMTQAGLLFQLDWIEKYTFDNSQERGVIQNTFLDFSVAQHNASASSEDPDTSSRTNFAVGLKVEF
jgi:opacity protein-like surface antigen